MKPLVGVMPLWDDKKESIWMLPGYMDGIIQAGALPIIFPFSQDEKELLQLVGMCSGILFTGGQDVFPELYRETPEEALVSYCQKRDIMESIVLKAAIRDDKSILGICRGIQFINVALGGTLYQDLPKWHPSDVIHHQQAPYDVPVHKVRIIKDSPLYRCLGTESAAVNSYHHQAVKTIAPQLEPMAVSPDGLTEALFMPNKNFLWAVQWHPEFSYKKDPNSRKIFSAFVNSMR